MDKKGSWATGQVRLAMHVSISCIFQY
uniref:Uncharacterized protein n=1 Tax=Arundo donax TaxID=35708 RepID=A0A0A9FU46_ARUDO